jgi:hypothetical protein
MRHSNYSASRSAKPDQTKDFASKDVGARRPDATRTERGHRFSISLGESQSQEHDMLRDILATVGQSRRYIAHGNSFGAGVADIN